MKKPNVINSKEEVAEFLASPSDWIAPTERKARRNPSHSFAVCLARVLEPHQLEYTAEEIRNAAQGCRKIMSLIVPRKDLDVLQKYNALALPIEILRHMDNFDGHGRGHVSGGRLQAPLGDVVDLNPFLVPLNMVNRDSRPSGSLYDAFERQLARLNTAVLDHDARLKVRAENYMLGREIVTAKQRVLSHMMDTYQELNWAEDFLPYMILNERKV